MPVLDEFLYWDIDVGIELSLLERLLKILDMNWRFSKTNTLSHESRDAVLHH